MKCVSSESNLLFYPDFALLRFWQHTIIAHSVLKSWKLVFHQSCLQLCYGVELHRVEKTKNHSHSRNISWWISCFTQFLFSENSESKIPEIFTQWTCKCKSNRRWSIWRSLPSTLVWTVDMLRWRKCPIMLLIQDEKSTQKSMKLVLLSSYTYSTIPFFGLI